MSPGGGPPAAPPPRPEPPVSAGLSPCALPPLSLKVEYDKLANEKTEMQRHYVMVRDFNQISDQPANVISCEPASGGGGDTGGRPPARAALPGDPRAGEGTVPGARSRSRLEAPSQVSC